MATSFQIQPIGRASKLTLALLASGCVALAGLTWACRCGLVETMLVAALVSLGLAGLFAWFGIAQARSSITIDGQTLALRLPMYSRTISLDRLILESLTRIDAETGDPYRLTWRTNGLSVPGYNLGWFQTKAAGKVLAAMTRADAVACQTKDGYSLLVSVSDADGDRERCLRFSNGAAVDQHRFVRRSGCVPRFGIEPLPPPVYRRARHSSGRSIRARPPLG